MAQLQLEKMLNRNVGLVICFNTASGMALLQLRLVSKAQAYGHRQVQYRKRYGPVATVPAARATRLGLEFQYRKR